MDLLYDVFYCESIMQYKWDQPWRRWSARQVAVLAGSGTHEARLSYPIYFGPPSVFGVL